MTSAKMPRGWKHQRATSLPHAMELCVKYAKGVHNLSVERIAERMGLTSHWRLYKWMADGNMPVRYVRAFEHACGGCDYVTRYLATSAYKLLIDIPTGRGVKETDIAELQALLSAAGTALVYFHRGDTSRDETLTAIEATMSTLAYHREQVVKHSQPELEMFGDEEPSDA